MSSRSAPYRPPRRTGLTLRNIGSGHKRHQKTTGKQLPTALVSLALRHSVVFHTVAFRFAQFQASHLVSRQCSQNAEVLSTNSSRK